MFPFLFLSRSVFIFYEAIRCQEQLLAHFMHILGTNSFRFLVFLTCIFAAVFFVRLCVSLLIPIKYDAIPEQQPSSGALCALASPNAHLKFSVEASRRIDAAEHLGVSRREIRVKLTNV